MINEKNTMFKGAEVIMSKYFKKAMSLAIVAMMSTSLLVGCEKTATNGNVTENNETNESTSTGTTAKAGTYEVTKQGFGGQITATVTLAEDGSIADIAVDVASETPALGGKAGPTVAESIVESQSLAVDAVTGATITSKAVLEAVEEALTNAGADVEAFKNKEVVKNGVDEEVTVDVVVAGAGGSGTAAALSAAEAGLDVLVIEKTASYGGNSKLASGFFAIGTDLQEAEGLELNIDQAVQDIMEFNQYLSNGTITRTIIENAADTIEWMQNYGVEFYLPSETTQYAHVDDLYKWKTYHKFVSQEEAFDSLYAALDKYNANVRYNTTLESIIKDEDGNVTGIVCQKDDGGKLTVHAKATVIATGGFGADTEKTAEILNSEYFASLGMPNAGEGITAIEEIGGINWDATPLLHACQLAESTVAQSSSSETLAGFSSSSLTQLLMSPLLWVDASGSRFTNEDVVYDTAFWANAAYSVGGRYYIIVDEATLKAYSEGTDIRVSNAGPGANMELDDMVSLADEAVKAGTAFKGSSLSELAQAAGMNADELEKTVERYNKLVNNGSDTDYGKSSDSLLYTVEEGNYYALDVRGVYLGTIGGVKVDEKLQVIDIDYNAIPGLYAAGTTAGGYYTGIGYPPYEGLACGFAFTSGRLAGISASQYVLSLGEQ